MKRQIEYPKLLLRLQELSDVVPQLSPEDAFRGIKGMDLKAKLSARISPKL